MEVDGTCTTALSPSRLLSVHERACGHSECSHRFDGESHRVFVGNDFRPAPSWDRNVSSSWRSEKVNMYKLFCRTVK